MSTETPIQDPISFELEQAAEKLVVIFDSVVKMVPAATKLAEDVESQLPFVHAWTDFLRTRPATSQPSPSS
eukprot:ANDGO_08496.mRNA.1 hypothetical protein